MGEHARTVVPAAILIVMISALGCQRPLVERSGDTARTAETPTPGELENEAPLIGSVTPAGKRVLIAGKVREQVDWYTIPIDHELFDRAIRQAELDPRVACPTGSKAGYVGTYTEIEWCEFFDGMHDQLSALGMSFTYRSEALVEPGPGDVGFFHWLVDDVFRRGEDFPFEMNESYLLCFDRLPVETAKNGGGRPATTIEGELSHVTAVIAVQRTFDFTRFAKTNAFYVDPRDLRALEVERHGAPELEIRLQREGTFSATRPLISKTSVTLPESVVHKVLYAWNSREWSPTDSRRATGSPPVSKTTVTWDGGHLGERRISASYDNGGWYATSENARIMTAFPLLLYEVDEEIDELFSSRE